MGKVGEGWELTFRQLRTPNKLTKTNKQIKNIYIHVFEIAIDYELK